MSRPLRARVAGAAVSAAVTLGIDSVGWAYFTTIGAGGASGSVTTLAASTISSAAAGAGTVALSWTVVTPPGPGTVAYYVTRDGGFPGGNCPSSSSASSVTSCTDSGVSVATHQYTVTAVWRLWTATSTTSTVQVSFGPATHLLLGASTTTPTAGVGDNLTVTAQDASNNTVSTYTGSRNLTFAGASTIGAFTPTVTNSSGTAIAFGTATATSFTSGVATVSGTSNGAMKLYKAQTALITVSDGSINNGSGLSITVSPLTAASLSLTAAAATPTAGLAHSLTITALDTYGNTATGYAGSKSLTFAGASTIGTHHPTVTSSSGTAINFGTTTAISFTNGIATVSGASNGVMTLYTAEAALITVTDGSISNGSGLPVTVSAGPVASLSLSAATTTPTAGTADNLTIIALDVYGNGFTGSQSLTFGGASTIGAFSPTVTSSSGTATSFGTATAISFTNGTASVSGSSNGGMKLYKAQTALITVGDGSVNNGSGLSVAVAPGLAASLSLTAATATPAAGAGDNLTITALDSYGNTATAYAGSHNLTFGGASTIGAHIPTVTSSSGAATSFSTATAISFTNGVGSVSGSSNGVMTLYKAETALVTVTDGSSNNGAGLSITVGAAAQQPSGLAYVDQILLAADQVSGTTSANTTLTATETAGDHVGNTYTATAIGTGGFTINVEAYAGLIIHQTFTYSVIAIDAYGNQTTATTVTATDTK